MRKVVMTGTNGFIGGQLKRRILQMGCDVISIEKKTWKKDLCNLWMDPLVRPGDISCIFHNGANTSVQYREPDIWEDNYYLTKQLMKFAYEYKVPKFIFASTSAIYGNDDFPCNHYGWSKFISEDYGLSFFDHTETKFIALRYFNVFGPGEKRKEKLASVILQSYLNEEFTLFEGISRDYVYITDVIGANVYAFRHMNSSGCFEVGTGVATETGKFISYANPKWKQIPVVECPYENIQNYTCANKNNYMYGWKPQYTTEEGAREYGEYIRNGSWEYEL